MFDVVSRFAHRWRFKFNFGTDKTAVMVCGDQIGGYEWTLGGGNVPVVDNYKYLGVRLKSEEGYAVGEGQGCVLEGVGPRYGEWARVAEPTGC